ncbi:unnamed protein product [Diabrotica balteata]|uniref:ATP-dependent DNA helicase n=1 Tax=Diabrotica balteata TaxID=107213 RepID=A0A9N9TAQ7_DIABA|nr:unnamed protein product [Diabrotica balteata]
MYVRVEGDRLNYLRSHQNALRSSNYTTLQDYVYNRATEENTTVGRVVILPSTFIGWPRNMIERYQDAMAIIRKFGKPHFFITMTCNRNYIEKGHVFGNPATVIYTIKFKKRGLRHAHILVTVSSNDIIRDLLEVEKVICAELPDPDLDPNLYHKVKSHMIHDPCRTFNPLFPCMKMINVPRNIPNNIRKKPWKNRIACLYIADAKMATISYLKTVVWITDGLFLTTNFSSANTTVTLMLNTVVVSKLLNIFTIRSFTVNPTTTVMSSEDADVQFQELYNTTTPEQRMVIDTVVKKINDNTLSTKMMYIDAPAGCGKIYIQRILILYAKSKSIVCLSTAFTGIAASLMEGGRTIHNLFKLPLQLNGDAVSSLSIESPHAKYLKKASIIMIDEASTTPGAAIDRLYKDLYRGQPEADHAFAGKIVLMSGDFRQTLPVIPKAGRARTVEGSIKRNPLWRKVEKFTLSKNMRVNEGEDNFANYLLSIGNGTAGENITLPNNIKGEGDVVEFVYGNIQNFIAEGLLTELAILVPTNDDCAQLNQKVCLC